jgi:hypothetical protein
LNEFAQHKLYRLYGEDNFIIKQIDSAETEEEACKLETNYISLYNSVKLGYNICHEGSSHSHTEESKQKMSLARIGKHPTDETKKLMSKQHSGEKNVMFGKHHTQATKDTISAKNKGKTGYWKGRKLPQETKNKVSASRKGLTVGENNPGAKLTLEQVNEIKDLLNNSKLTQKQIWIKFNVSRATIHRIKSGVNWK